MGPWLANIALPGEFTSDVLSGSSIKQEQGCAFIPTAVGNVTEMAKVMSEGIAKHRVWEREVDHIPA